MAPIFYASIVLLFAAVVLSIEGTYEWWNSRHGPAARRVESRIRTVSAGGQLNRANLTILKNRLLSESSLLNKGLMYLPRPSPLSSCCLRMCRWSLRWQSRW
jgi:tight adherence protein B